MYPQQIIDALRHVRYPGTGKDLVESGMLEDDIRISGFEVSFSLIFQKENDPFMKSVIKAAQAAIKTYAEPNAVINIQPKIIRQATPQTESNSLSKIKHIIAISSGKGGVGKSTVAANIAITLSKRGFRVGLLDADIHGPSQPKMFGVEDGRPVATTIDGRDLIEPIESFGVKLLSIGFFVAPDNAVVYRGSLASKAIKQMLTEADWGELDYLLIDMPPGTSDIHLTVVSTVKLSGAIIVTTPQPVALVDARKGIDMYQNDKINVPVIGIIENMSWFTPAELPENKYFIFGKDGGKILAEQLGVRLLGQIPLIQSIRQAADDGSPITIQEGHPVAKIYDSIVDKIVIQ